MVKDVNRFIRNLYRHGFEVVKVQLNETNDFWDGYGQYTLKVYYKAKKYQSYEELMLQHIMNPKQMPLKIQKKQPMMNMQIWIYVYVDHFGLERKFQGWFYFNHNKVEKKLKFLVVT